MTKKNTLNFIDIFAGAGGLSCGLELAGLNCLLGIDYDKYAMQTFAKNHRKAQAFCGDIRKLQKKELLEKLDGNPVHLVVGGPPCQGFSTVGLGNPDDMRNTLFLEFCRVVRITKPYFVIIENVTGLLAKKNEDTLQNIFKKFKSLGYDMDVQVMSSQNYGVPEKRRRTILIGTRINVEIEFPKKTHDVVIAKTHRPSMTVGDALSNLATKSGEFLNHDLDSAHLKSKIEKKRIARIPEGKGIRYEADEKKYFTPSLKLGVDWKNLRENRFRQTKYQRLDRSLPSPTIMTHRHSYFHPVEDRYLTQREAAALQSFPNNFEFMGPLSAQWRQIGNAVPPLMAKAIGKSILKMYKNYLNERDSKALKKENTKTRIRNVRETAFVYKK
ncbi:DNA cytosine methyltransferase [Halobacteriovorax sp. HLS]|uniref:DNA cytosine methyltransferase n=1 Tax=Halobacteriovorax sp. HLS TaxID=2234000 RepID=UPI000FD6BFFB|nr:DNA cytosine methyltransferase [Halobacteriovorax sp. HLS]